MSYKQGTTTATLKPKSHCLSIAKYKFLNNFKYWKSETDLHGIDDRFFDDTFVVISCVPELNIVQVDTGEGTYLFVPIDFIKYFIEW